MLRRQLRALIQAANGRSLSVMFPMIAEVSEVVRARRLLDLERRETQLRRLRQPPGVLHRQHHLHQRRARQIALRAKLLDQQLERKILVGVGRKRRLPHLAQQVPEGRCGREVRPQPMRCPADLPNRIVDMAPERLAAAVAVEQRRKHLQRQCRRHEQGVSLQRREDHVTQFTGGNVILGQLTVLLDLRGLWASGDAPVDPS